MDIEGPLPDILFGKIFIGLFIGIIVIGSFALILKYLEISSSCSSDSQPQDSDQNKGPNVPLITFICIIILSGMAAQAMNYSYNITKYVSS